MIGLFRGYISPWLFELKLALIALALAGSAAGGAWATAKVKEAEIERLKRADTVRENDDLKLEVSLQAKLAKTDAEISRTYARDNEREAAITRTIIKEIPAHVTARSDARYSVPYGFVRVYDAAILDAEPAALSLPAGRTDDTASPVTTSALAENAAENYAACRANAEQLRLLEEWARRQYPAGFR